MTSRIRLLVAACLCAAFFIAVPAQAQVETPLRASHQGSFLPEGTEIIVLTEPGRHVRDGRYQPEFFPARDFPRTSSGTPRRDRLDATGHSNRSYAATQESGRLYFIYALTPDSTLYWSYSALRDSLKYDVVSTGVMSVAPVASAEVREAVMRTFFKPRVRVIMREKEEGEAEAEADLIESRVGDAIASPAGDNDGSAGGVDGGAAGLTIEDAMDGAGPSISSDRMARNAGERLPAEKAGEAYPLEPTATRSDVAQLAAPAQFTRSVRSGVTLPPLLAWALLLVMLVAVGVPVYLAREARNELKQVRREMISLRGRMAASGDTPAGEGVAGTTQRWTGQGDRHDPDPDLPWK